MTEVISKVTCKNWVRKLERMPMGFQWMPLYFVWITALSVFALWRIRLGV